VTAASTGPKPLAARAPLTVVVLAVLLAVAAAARLCLGQEFGWPQGNLAAAAWRLFVRDWAATVWPRWFETPGALTIMDLRLLRVVLAVLVGAALASGGVALQALLRNPLAEPFILGLSSGAAVGVMGQSLLGFFLGAQVGGGQLGALIGAAGAMLIVWAASRRCGVLDPLGLLLTGVVLSTICGAIIMLLNYLVGPGGLRENLSYWMMGYLNESVGSGTVASVTLVTLVGITMLLAAGRSMDVATFSDTEAQSLGVNIVALRTLLFLVASLLAAGAVVLAGPVAFVGLICPHLVRLIQGPRHGPLVFSSALAGATLILLADCTAVLLDRALGGGLMPIGIFTAMIGGPLFLWVLRPQLGRGAQ